MLNNNSRILENYYAIIPASDSYSLSIQVGHNRRTTATTPIFYVNKTGAFIRARIYTYNQLYLKMNSVNKIRQIVEPSKKVI